MIKARGMGHGMRGRKVEDGDWKAGRKVENGKLKVEIGVANRPSVSVGQSLRRFVASYFHFPFSTFHFSSRLPMLKFTAALASVSFTASALAQNLLTNPDFEQVPGNQQGQGILPSDWLEVQPSVDTYSNDGSYGLPPNGFGNFTGVTAFSGIRWVGAWSSIPEIFGQTMPAPLVPGRSYVLRAH